MTYAQAKRIVLARYPSAVLSDRSKARVGMGPREGDSLRRMCRIEELSTGNNLSGPETFRRIAPAWIAAAKLIQPGKPAVQTGPQTFSFGNVTITTGVKAPAKRWPLFEAWKKRQKRKPVRQTKSQKLVRS